MRTEPGSRLFGTPLIRPPALRANLRRLGNGTFGWKQFGFGSSARVERRLQLCVADIGRVLECSTQKSVPDDRTDTRCAVRGTTATSSTKQFDCETGIYRDKPPILPRTRCIIIKLLGQPHGRESIILGEEKVGWGMKVSLLAPPAQGYPVARKEKLAVP